jgi:hypothetical protein
VLGGGPGGGAKGTSAGGGGGAGVSAAYGMTNTIVNCANNTGNGSVVVTPVGAS